MRKIALLVAAPVALVGAGIAYAGPTNQGLNVKASPTKAGTKAKPSAVSLSVETTAGPAGNYAARKAVLSFDKNIVFNGRFFKQCRLSVVEQDASRCPKGSRVGSGAAKAELPALQVVSDLTVKAYNGTGGNALFLKVHTDSPVTIDGVLVGKLKSAGGRYGTKLDITIPQNLQQPIPGASPTLTRFFTKIKELTVTRTRNGRKVRVPFIGLKGCSGGKLAVHGDFSWTDGSTTSADTAASCRK